MPILDAFLQALQIDPQTRRVSPIRLAQMLGNAASAVENLQDGHTQMLLTNLIGPWALSIARLAPQKWKLPVNVPPACEMDVRPEHVCGQFAIGGCHACGRPICLQHALVAADASLMCWSCVRVAAKHTKAWVPRNAAAPRETIEWAYELLGVTKTSTNEEVKKAYKERIKRFHPDRTGDGSDKINGDLVRMVKRAYDLIMQEREP